MPVGAAGTLGGVWTLGVFFDAVVMTPLVSFRGFKETFCGDTLPQTIQSGKK